MYKNLRAVHLVLFLFVAGCQNVEKTRFTYRELPGIRKTVVKNGFTYLGKKDRLLKVTDLPKDVIMRNEKVLNSRYSIDPKNFTSVYLFKKQSEFFIVEFYVVGDNVEFIKIKNQSSTEGQNGAELMRKILHHENVTTQLIPTEKVLPYGLKYFFQSE